MDNKTTLLLSSGKYKNARLSLLIVLALSVVNIFIMFADTYFLFSAHISLLIANVGLLLKMETGDNVYLIIGIVISLITLLPYLFSWIFSKKRVGWLIVSLVLFIIDTVILAIEVPTYLQYGDVSIFIDLIVHIVVVYELYVGVQAGFAMKKEMAEAEQAEMETSSPFDLDAELAPETVQTRELTITRQKAFSGCAISLIIYVNGVEVCSLKNGETEKVSVPTTAFELGAALKNGFAVNKLTVENGIEPLTYAVKIKAGFFSSSVIIDRK